MPRLWRKATWCFCSVRWERARPRWGVVSPTYTILEVYDGRVPVFHFDFYRLSGPDELRTLDPREYYDQGVTIMEWPERMEPLWPTFRHELRLGFDPVGRWVEALVHGPGPA
jgi:tRNA threonylcarbamoyladenosine biosynthesis protein TsaE